MTMTDSAVNGSPTSLVRDTCPQELSNAPTSAASKPKSSFLQPAISSPGLAAGRSPLNSPDGQTPNPPGPAPVRVSRFRALDSEKAMPINDTCGPLFTRSSPSADLQRSLESRLRARMDVNGSPEYALTWKDWDMPSGVPDLCAASVGAPGIRQRIYWVADAAREQVGRTGQSRQLPDERVANTKRARLEKRPEQSARQECEAIERGVNVGRLDNSASTRRESQRQKSEIEARNETWVRGPERRRVERYWDAFEIVECRDGRRRIEPGSFPLAHGVPARMGRLRAYGNAICVPLAVQFIKAVMDALEIRA
jgi:hypothetical protein